MCILLSIGAFAQPQPQQQKKEDFKGKFERIKSEKIAFFTDKLELTPEEAQVFWPVYNEYWKASQKAHRETMAAFGSTMPKKGETVSSSELEKRLDTYIKLAAQEQKVKSDFYPKFKKVLPIEKVAKLYQAEEAFRMKMLHSIGGRSHSGKPRGGFNGGRPDNQGPMMPNDAPMED